MSSFLDRLSATPERLHTLAVAAIVGIIVGTVLVIPLARQQAQDAADGEARQIAACERGNVLRAEVERLAEGTEDAMTAILDVTFHSIDPVLGEQLAAAVTPALEDFGVVVESIQILDCEAVVTEEP